MMTFKQRREALNLTQHAFTRKFNLEYGWYVQTEQNNRIGNSNIHTVIKLALAYGCKLSDLIDTEDMTRYISERNGEI